MKKILATIFCLQFSCCLFSQSLDDLINQINRSDKSFKNIVRILAKFSINKKNTIYDTLDYGRYRYSHYRPQPDLNNRIVSKKLMAFHSFSEKVFYWKKINDLDGRIASSADVELIYKNNRIASIVVIDNNKIDEKRKIFIPDTCFKQYDSVVIKSELGKYNAENYTYFDWKDIFDPQLINSIKYRMASIDNFSIVPGCCGPDYISDDARPFLPLIEKKDIKEIVFHCKSLNPVRKAYGAFCLYYLQKEGYRLLDEEKYLMERIMCSEEKIAYSWGCIGHREGTEISKILEYKEIEFYCTMVKDYLLEKSLKNKGKTSMINAIN